MKRLANNIFTLTILISLRNPPYISPPPFNYKRTTHCKLDKCLNYYEQYDCSSVKELKKANFTFLNYYLYSLECTNVCYEYAIPYYSVAQMPFTASKTSRKY